MIRTVAWYEFLFTVKRRGFLIATFGMPVIMLVYGLIVSGLSSLSYSSFQRLAQKPLGVVDNSGLLTAPGQPLAAIAFGEPYEYTSLQLEFRLRDRKEGDEINESDYRRTVVRYKDFESAQADYYAGKIRNIVVVSEDYVSSALITLYHDPDPLLSMGGSFPIGPLLAQSLLARGNHDPETARRILQGPHVKELNLDAGGVAQEADPLQRSLSFGAPLGISFVLIMALMMNSGMLVSSMVQEKENKVFEILLTSITPEELLFGKVIGIVLAGILQIFIWMLMVGCAPFVWFLLNHESISLQVEWSQIVLALIFGVLGLIFFGLLFAGMGSLGSTERDTRYLSAFALLTSGFPLFLSVAIVLQPNGLLARIISLIPLFSPTTLIIRVVNGVVPWWEIGLALVILLISIHCMAHLSARIVRAGMLTYGQKFSFKSFLQAVLASQS